MPEIQDQIASKRTEKESADLLAGSQDSMLIGAGETLDGLTQNLRITHIRVNEDAVLSSLIADDVADSAGTEVLTGTTIGFKNLDGATLITGAYINPGHYKISRTFQSVGVTSGSVMAYYNYVIGTDAEL